MLRPANVKGVMRRDRARRASSRTPMSCACGRFTPSAGHATITGCARRDTPGAFLPQPDKHEEDRIMDLRNSPFMADMTRVSNEIYAKGWGEANGGNISIRIRPEEMFPFEHCLTPGPKTDLPFALPELAGDFFLVTGTGVFFRNIADSPHESLGVVRINQTGDGFFTLWGYSTGGKPTSELPAHLLSHAARKRISEGRDRVTLHTHAGNLIALTSLLPLETKTFTKALWEMLSECLLHLPDGVGILPWTAPGGLEIGRETAALMEKHRLVLWAHHGVFGTGENMDQAFGLIETADKAAEILLKTMAAGGPKQAIGADQLKAMAEAYGLTPLKGVLD